MLKSTPVWRIALSHESPSMPTQADAECVPELPEGSLGVGTVNVAVTDLYVPYKKRVNYTSLEETKDIVTHGSRVVHGTGPVRAVLDLRHVRCRRFRHRPPRTAGAHRDTLLVALPGRRGGERGGGNEGLEDECGDEHYGSRCRGVLGLSNRKRDCASLRIPLLVCCSSFIRHEVYSGGQYQHGCCASGVLQRMDVGPCLCDTGPSPFLIPQH